MGDKLVAVLDRLDFTPSFLVEFCSAFLYFKPAFPPVPSPRHCGYIFYSCFNRGALHLASLPSLPPVRRFSDFAFLAFCLRYLCLDLSWVCAALKSTKGQTPATWQAIPTNKFPFLWMMTRSWEIPMLL